MGKKNKMNKEIEKLIKINVLRDIEIMFMEKRGEGFIIPDICFELLKELESKYMQTSND